MDTQTWSAKESRVVSLMKQALAVSSNDFFKAYEPSREESILDFFSRTIYGAPDFSSYEQSFENVKDNLGSNPSNEERRLAFEKVLRLQQDFFRSHHEEFFNYFRPALAFLNVYGRMLRKFDDVFAVNVKTLNETRAHNEKKPKVEGRIRALEAELNKGKIFAGFGNKITFEDVNYFCEHFSTSSVENLIKNISWYLIRVEYYVYSMPDSRFAKDLREVSGSQKTDFSDVYSLLEGNIIRPFISHGNTLRRPIPEIVFRDVVNRFEFTRKLFRRFIPSKFGYCKKKNKPIEMEWDDTPMPDSYRPYTQPDMEGKEFVSPDEEAFRQACKDVIRSSESDFRDWET
ncbi:MAG: hypothetical protein ACOCXG_01345 [Nanoarchaeota archaeon]